MTDLKLATPHRRKLRKEEIEAGLDRLAPFHHAIDLPYGLSTFVPSASRQDRERTRLKSLLDHAWEDILAACGGTLEGKRVLDIACNCGGFSVEAAKAGADYVLGIDIESHYIKQASFVRDALSLDQVEFKELDLLELDPAKHGTFDLVLCFGILYHLEDPVLSLKRISGVSSDVIVVDTTLMKVPLINSILERWPLWHMRRVSGVDPDASNISTSRWRPKEFCQFSPNATAVVDLLEYAGFEDVHRLKASAKGLEKRYYNGSRATFIATQHKA